MICWFERGVTDSFGPELAAMDCLGFLPGSACPHYDGEERRRPVYTQLVADGFPGGIAADDEVGVHFVGRELHEVVTSREGATAYRVTPDGERSVYAGGMGIATGIAFDEEENLYVGDRSGTIFKINRDQKIFVFATLEPGVAAYHLAFGPERNLYVTSPTTSSFDHVFRISPAGELTSFYRGLGRPQGLAFDVRGNLYVAASVAGQRGVVRLSPDAKPELVISGYGIVGLAFTARRSLVLTTNTSLIELPWEVEGRPLLP